MKPFSCAECNYSFTRRYGLPCVPVISQGLLCSDLLVRHERLQHRKDRENQKDRAPVTQEPNHVPAQEPPRKRSRTSFDASRPVPEIPGMMSSPAIIEMNSSHYGPATAFTPMSGAHNSYSLTALSMAAEYQALQGNVPNGNTSDQNVQMPPTMAPAPVDVSFDEAQHIIPPNPMVHMQGPTLEESLDSLVSFMDHEPLTSYHFSTLMSAEQPM